MPSMSRHLTCLKWWRLIKDTPDTLRSLLSEQIHVCSSGEFMRWECFGACFSLNGGTNGCRRHRLASACNITANSTDLQFLKTFANPAPYYDEGAEM